MKLNALTADETAQLLGISRRHLDAEVKRGKIPRIGVGRKVRFEWNAVRDAWLATQIAIATPKRVQEDADSLEEAQRRKANADAALSEIKAQKLRGETVEVAEAVRQVGRIYANLNTRLRAIPSRMMHELFGETNRVKFKATLENEIEQAQKELVELAATRSSDSEGDADGEDG